MLRRLWGPILARLSRVLAQSEIDGERLRELGCRGEAISVAGNLKFDVRATEEADAARRLRASGARFLVAGSTLDGEEAALLEAWPRLKGADPQLAMVIAPRHPERFGAVAGLLERSGIAWTRRSGWKTQASERNSVVAGQIVLLDTIGELASVYSLATVAFVGGSVVEAGGHNPLEPAQFGVPIVMGPHYANFRAITDDLIAHEAIRITPRERLAETFVELLTAHEGAAAMGVRARSVFEQQAGATARCVEAIGEVLGHASETPAEARSPGSGERA
jgi:3-deoxy-D-manno-octulosonic-acid transferase